MSPSTTFVSLACLMHVPFAAHHLLDDPTSVYDDRPIVATPWDSAQTNKTLSRAIYPVNWEEKTFIQHSCTTIDAEDSPEWSWLSRRGKAEKRQEFSSHPPRILRISSARANHGNMMETSSQADLFLRQPARGPMLCAMHNPPVVNALFPRLAAPSAEGRSSR